MSRNHDQIRNDPRWIAARLACLDRDGYACVRCGTDEALQVDHITPLAVTMDLAFDIDNLQTLCRSCHDEKGREDVAAGLVRPTWINPRYPELRAVLDADFLAEPLATLQADPLSPPETENISGVA